MELVNFIKYINQPVRTYSSGMKSRLGFAIAVNVDPDILIVDEALSVGDDIFRTKCLAKMTDFVKNGKTIFFVSHSLFTIKSFCTKCAWIKDGELITYGKTGEVVAKYETYLKEEKGNLTDAELVELKEEYYQQYLQTSFEHEVYTDGWLKNLSTTLDYIPIVGGVKNAIEGLCGYTMTGEKLTTQERISYTALGILTTAVDVFTLGTASGLIQGGKFVGKELAKSGIKKLGKYAIMDSVSSVTMGWGSQFAGEKLRDFGLSAEGIFAIHLIASVSTVGVSKLTKEKVIDSKTFTNWSDMKNANKGTVTKLVDEYKPNGATHPRKWLAVDGTSLTIDTVKRPFGSTYQIWHYTDSTGVVTSGIKGIDDITLGQIHHYASNKNKEYTNQFKEILEIYGLDLDDDWNKRYISSHIGSHPKEYHEFVLEQLNKADRLAKGNVEKFKRYYEKLVIDKVNKNPEMLNKSYWRNK